MALLLSYFLSLFLITLFSFSLVDPNLTLVNHPVWENFRNFMVNLGYHKRELSSVIYVMVIAILFIFHFLFINRYKIYTPLTIAAIIGITTLIAYPFLSHDFFNYIFDAKILTFYWKNPYFTKALDFPNDPWIRFMHWTHRTYPYGPSFLALTLIPSALALGKFVLNYIFFKIMFLFFYLLSAFSLFKIKRQTAIYFITSPLVIIEGLINSHNELFAVGIALFGIYLIQKKKNIIWGRLCFFISAGIKYMSLPVIFISKNEKIDRLSLVGLILLIGYYSITKEIQPWYFLNLLIFLPFYPKLINSFNIFFAGLMLSYYPYIRFGQWDNPNNVNYKHLIILFFLGLNLSILYFENKKRYDQKNSSIFQ